MCEERQGEHLRHSRMKRFGLIAACIVSGIVLAGCSDSPPVADPGTSPQGSGPDRSSLDIAVNPEYQAQGTSVAGSGLIVPASCAVGVAWQNAFYIIRPDGLNGVPDPQPAEPLEGVVVPGCNDTGGTSEPDLPMSAWAIEGIDTDKAIFVRYR